MNIYGCTASGYIGWATFLILASSAQEARDLMERALDGPEWQDMLAGEAEAMGLEEPQVYTAGAVDLLDEDVEPATLGGHTLLSGPDGRAVVTMRDSGLNG